MNLLQAKAEAKKKARETRIDQVISFDGVSYSVHNLPKYTGNITEVVKFQKPKKTSDVKPTLPKKETKKSETF